MYGLKTRTELQKHELLALTTIFSLIVLAGLCNATTSSDTIFKSIGSESTIYVQNSINTTQVVVNDTMIGFFGLTGGGKFQNMNTTHGSLMGLYDIVPSTNSIRWSNGTVVGYNIGTIEITIPANDFIEVVYLQPPAPASDNIPAGGYPFFNPTSEQLNNGFEKILYRNWNVRFNVGNSMHTLTIDNITPEGVFITIHSDSQQAFLVAGEERKFELDNDGYYDLYVRLNSIQKNSSANMTIKAIHEAMVNVTTPPAQHNCTEGSKRCTGNIEECINGGWVVSQNCAYGCDNATLTCRAAAEAEQPVQQGQPQQGVAADYTPWIIGILVLIVIVAAAAIHLRGRKKRKHKYANRAPAVRLRKFA
jgi:hypothetical protein